MWLYEETRDQLSCMYRQEIEVYQCSIDYMKTNVRGEEYNRDYDKWRRTVCKWSYDIVDHFGFDREVVYISLNYLDRYIANCLNKRQRSNGYNFNDTILDQICAREFQLAGITGLYIALKVHGNIEEESEDKLGTCNRPQDSGSSFSLSILDFSRLSRGVYSEEDLIDMEKDLLECLKWHVNPPTPVDFLVHFLHSIDADIQVCEGKCKCQDEYLFENQTYSLTRCYNVEMRVMSKKIKFVLYELARYFLELAVSVYDLSVRQRPSSIALASIVMALEALDDDCIPSFLRSKYLKGLSEVITPEHKIELEYVKVLIQDVCNEALSSSSKLSSHIAHVLGKIHEKSYEESKPTSSPRCVSLRQI